MNQLLKGHTIYIVLIPSSILVLLICGSGLAEPTYQSQGHMPWREAGLTEQEATAHLIDRFTYGQTPGLVDAVALMGLEKWFLAQLTTPLVEPALQERLARLPSLELSNREILEKYLLPGQVRRQALAAGWLDPADLEGDRRDPKEIQRSLRVFARSKGYLPPRQPVEELIAAKIIRAVYTEQQVAEVMTDFWFNHFYISARDNQCRRFVGTYERDAIRPHVFADFRTMLGASAKHPAMLLYLDNAQSTAADTALTTAELTRLELQQQPGQTGQRYRQAFAKQQAERQRRQQQMMAMVPEEMRPRGGLNENYARELLELHTLGVDGGYTQADVVNVARILTGWTHVPPDPQQWAKMQEKLQRHQRLGRELGWAVEGDFLFNPDRHDAESKQVLGIVFPAGGGLNEGEHLLDLLARHPATARHLAWKLCVRFVADDPPPELVARVASVFRTSAGDLRAVLWAVVTAPEFWAPAARCAKVKSPLEYTVSSLRALEAEVQRSRPLFQWIRRMGQPMYRYAAPTGFPDQAEFWLAAGSLVTRLQFGLALATGEIRGVRIESALFSPEETPPTVAGAVEYYSEMLMPERGASQDLAAVLANIDVPLDTVIDSDAHAQIMGVLLASPEFQQR